MLTRVLRNSPCLAGWLILAGAAAGSGEEPGSVVVSELMWSGSSASSSDEWIELFNRGSEPVDLKGWTITRATATTRASWWSSRPASCRPGRSS